MKYIDDQIVSKLTRNIDDHYRPFYIKSNGRSRRVYAVSYELANVQRVISDKILAEFKVDKAAVAYEKGCSVKKVLKAHRKAKAVIRIDIQDFFHNIDYFKVRKLLSSKYSQSEIDQIWSLISYDNHTPIGAVTSPKLANRIMAEFDQEIRKTYKKITYTRYADDLIFSTRKSFDYDFVRQIESIVYRYGFRINQRKTLVMGGNKPKRILGVIIDGKKTSLGAKKRKQIKKIVYKFTKGQARNQFEVLGILNYVKTFDSHLYKTLKRKYSHQRKGYILK